MPPLGDDDPSATPPGPTPDPASPQPGPVPQPPPVYQPPSPPAYQPPAYQPPAPGPSAAPYTPNEIPGPPQPTYAPVPPIVPPTPPGPPIGPYATDQGGAPPPYYAPPPGAPDGSAPKKHQGRFVFAVISIFALLLGGGFVAWSLTRPDGAPDPEQAVRNLFTAIDNEDMVGVLEVLPPSERSIIRDAVLDTVSNLQRVGVLSDFDAHKVPGATFDVKDLQLSSSQLSPTIVAVKITGGTITATSNPADVPVGDLIKGRVGTDLAKAKSETETENLAKDDIRLAVVNEKGGWHVSLFYSIAEAARGSSTAPPQFGQGPAPMGADSPEDAVRQMVRAGTDLDARLAIQTLPPDEMRVMYDYSTLFLADADKAAAQAKQDGYHGKVDRLDLRTDGDGSTRRVYATGFDATFGDKSSDVRVTFDGQCYQAKETKLEQPRSSNNRSYSSSPPFDGQICRDGTMKSNGTTAPKSSSTVTPFGAFGSGDATNVGVTVVEVDGKWYVSPTRTILDALLIGLHNLQRQDLEKVIDFFDGMSSSTFGSPSTGAYGTIPPISRTPGTTTPRTNGTTRRSTTTTVDPLCEDDPTLVGCDGFDPSSTTSTTRRRGTTTTTDPDAANTDDDSGFPPVG